MRRFHLGLRDLAGRHAQLKYYYVTAREMANLVHQAEQGQVAPLAAQSQANTA
jgi:hypothetical protein